MLVFSALAGAFLILKELIPLLIALSSGVVRTRGHNSQRVTRQADPERFRALCMRRFKGMGLGLLVIAFGISWAFLGLFALIPAFIVGGILAANARKPRRRDDLVTTPKPQGTVGNLDL